MSTPEDSILPSQGQFLVYLSEDGRMKIEVRLESETVWLTQQHMADLFQTTQQNISLHLQNIYDEGELQRGATHKDFLSVRQEGARSVQRRVDFYNLDAIISVGYRVKSAVATRFRIWATQKLREYIVKGFILDDERLKNPDQPVDYFEELLRRIQDIRTSERRFYQKITDIYATSIDYDPTQPESITFFQTVQNKMHWAIYFWRDPHGHELHLLIDRGGNQLTVAEIKSGRTVASDWFRLTQQFAEWVPNSSSAILHGGDTDQPRTSTPVFSWRNFIRWAEVTFNYPTAP